MKKRANEIFKLKEPDVKIVALDDLAKEGTVDPRYHEPQKG